jgi:AraC-like DNA-binding protein
MAPITLDTKTILLLQDIPGITPVIREYYESWSIRVFFREEFCPHNYLSPNRRDYYKVMLMTAGTGVFTMGKKTYYIEAPVLMFVPPTEIISWNSLSAHNVGYYCVFRKSFADENPNLKMVMDKHRLFTDSEKYIVRLNGAECDQLVTLFSQMKDAEEGGGPVAEDALQAYLQLVMIAGIKIGNYPKPDLISEEFHHIHEFFQLLEKEAANVNYTNPIRIRTAKEFADHLKLSPNHLNALLKKHTGQPVSMHIKNRLLDESKALLLQTDWTLQDIGYAIGFSDQPNFSAFFKKLTGMTPADFRKQSNR